MAVTPSSSRCSWQGLPWLRSIAMASFFIVAVFFLGYSFGTVDSRTLVFGQVSSSSAVNVPLEVFQVEAPLRKSYAGAVCKQIVVQHNFAASYGTPFVGMYTPPRGCNFTTTIFNMSITSIGINYDRLSLLFLGDVEVWRSTTAMPVRTGIFYNFQKDMTIFDTLLHSEQKVIMQLDNIFDSTFTGNFNVTITALYYDDHQTLTPADLILPISTQSSAQNASSVISLPDGNATVSFILPRNAGRAVVSILASGNGNEEFWYSKVITSYAGTFDNTAISGYGPFREVQLLIDENLAGVSWPFPTIFTGGISPGLWVPIVGIDTYDLPSFEIDIGPWLGLLCDGEAHSFELKVVGVDGTIGSNWWITGSVFIWVDSAGNQTTGTALESYIPPTTFSFSPSITTSGTTNTSPRTHLTAKRTIHHSSIITTSSGSRTLTWTQSLTYSNTQNYTAKGYNKTLSQLTSGTSTFSPTSNNSSSITNTFSYPLSFHQAYIVPLDVTTSNSTIIAELDRALLSKSIPILSYLTSPSTFNTHVTLSTRQNGSCIYYWNDTYYQFAGAIDPAIGTVGVTEQRYSSIGPLVGGGVQTYGRHVKAVDGYEPVLVLDERFESAIELPGTESEGEDEL